MSILSNVRKRLIQLLLPPVIDVVDPPGGDVAGGTLVTVTGGRFVTGSGNGMTVYFRDSEGVNRTATDIDVVAENLLQCVTPEGVAGSGAIQIRNRQGAVGSKTWLYGTAPVITSVTPSFGQDGEATVITNLAGTGFVDGCTVTFDADPATDVVVVSPTHITCVTPEGSGGLVNVVVTNPDGLNSGASGDDAFEFANGPTVSAITPSSGVEAGGTAITNLAGTGFQTGCGVTFNGISATLVVRVSSTRITCVSPPGAGVADIVVTNPDTQDSGATGDGLFTYD